MTATAHIRRPTRLTLVAVLGVSQLAIAASTDNGTLTVGIGSGGVCGGFPLIDVGYVAALSIGSYSPTGLTGGKTVRVLLDYASCSLISELNVGGFSSNPGKNWLVSVTCNGVTNSGSAASYFYTAGGVAGWQWNQQFGFSGSGTTVSCTIVHN